MAGATHPFFGNQYTDGGYIIDSFKFPEGLTRETFGRIAKIAVPDNVPIKSSNISSVREATPLKAIAKSGAKGKWVIPVVIITFIAAVGGYFVYKHFKKKGTVEVLNVGICEHCGEPLTGAKLVADSDNPYIVCKKCGTKNYAKYPDNSETTAINADDKTSQNRGEIDDEEENTGNH